MGKEKQVEELQLWEISEVMLSNHYAQNAENGRVYYSRVTSRSDLPAAFWKDDWQYALEIRERDELQALSSANAARSHRGMHDGRLISQEIANNPSLGIARSSAEAAQRRRGKGKDKKKDKDGTKEEKKN